jgi:hypothetical protein
MVNSKRSSPRFPFGCRVVVEPSSSLVASGKLGVRLPNICFPIGKLCR